MTSQDQEIFEKALLMDSESRIALAYQLLTAETKHHEAWDAEISRRIEEYERGEVESIPIEEVMEHARMLLARK